mgnify:CR=1 FL=1
MHRDDVDPRGRTLGDHALAVTATDRAGIGSLEALVERYASEGEIGNAGVVPLPVRT